MPGDVDNKKVRLGDLIIRYIRSPSLTFLLSTSPGIYICVYIYIYIYIYIDAYFCLAERAQACMTNFLLLNVRKVSS